jgi:hypothetical protein
VRADRGAVVLLLSVLAACGPGGVTPGGTPAPAGSSAPDAGPVAAAGHEAERLLGLVTPPSNAMALPSAPAGLATPEMAPSVTSLVDEARFWQLDMPYPQAGEWLARQHPVGVVPAGSASTQDHGQVVIDSREYDAPAGPTWDSAQLQLTVAADGDTRSFLRADGLVVWLDPDPVRDDAVGKRMRLTVTESCPATDTDTVGVDNPGQSDLDAALLPTGTPTGGLLCEYGGLNGMPWILRVHRILDTSVATQLATATRQVRLAHPVGARRNCPGGDARADLLILSFPGRPDVDLWLNPSGCPAIANGHLRADAGPAVAAFAKAARP